MILLFKRYPHVGTPRGVVGKFYTGAEEKKQISFFIARVLFLDLARRREDGR